MELIKASRDYTSPHKLAGHTTVLTRRANDKFVLAMQEPSTQDLAGGLRVRTLGTRNQPFAAMAKGPVL